MGHGARVAMARAWHSNIAEPWAGWKSHDSGQKGVEEPAVASLFIPENSDCCGSHDDGPAHLRTQSSPHDEIFMVYKLHCAHPPTGQSSLVVRRTM